MNAAEYADDPTATREERLWLADMRGEAVAHVRAYELHLYRLRKSAEARKSMRSASRIFFRGGFMTVAR